VQGACRFSASGLGGPSLRGRRSDSGARTQRTHDGFGVCAQTICRSCCWVATSRPCSSTGNVHGGEAGAQAPAASKTRLLPSSSSPRWPPRQIDGAYHFHHQELPASHVNGSSSSASWPGCKLNKYRKPQTAGPGLQGDSQIISRSSEVGSQRRSCPWISLCKVRESRRAWSESAAGQRP